MEFGQKNKKERNSLIGRDKLDRSLANEWFSTPFDELPLIRPMRNWIRDVEEKMTQQMEILMQKSATGNSVEPIVYGWSLKVANGKPEFQEFGNIKDSSERNPVVDVLNTTDGIIIVVELPGVEKNEINVETTATELFVETMGTKKYKKNVKLPEEIDQASVTSNFKNGVLTVSIKKSNGNKRRVSVL